MNTGEIYFVNSADYFTGSGFFDSFTKIGKTITGKTASKLASKAAEKLIEKGAEKVGEKTGEVLGEKIYDKFSTTRRSKEPPSKPVVVTTQTTSAVDGVKPAGEGGEKLVEFLRKKEALEEEKKDDYKELRERIIREFLN